MNMHIDKQCHNDTQKHDCKECGFDCRAKHCDHTNCHHFYSQNPLKAQMACICPRTSCVCLGRDPDPEAYVLRGMDVFDEVVMYGKK